MPPEQGGGTTLGATLCFASELFIRQNRSDFRSECHSQSTLRLGRAPESPEVCLIDSSSFLSSLEGKLKPERERRPRSLYQLPVRSGLNQGDLRTHVSVVLPLEFGVGLDLPGARPVLLLNADGSGEPHTWLRFHSHQR